MSFDLSATAAVLLGRLGAVSFTDLDWCSEVEVYGWFDEAAERLASQFGVFVELQTVEGVTSPVTMPDGWLATIRVCFNGAKVRASGVSELLALDPGWGSAVCASEQMPTRYTLDAGSLGVMTLYPQPFNTAGELEMVNRVSAPAISSTQTTAPIPSVLSDYFLYFGLKKARGKESAQAMPEVAAYAEQRLQMLEQIIASYWGASE